ncbi:pectate lyase [Flaviramulus basaltis]|uniref:Pectate lyase n=2 Tax=Flaviramulus basaltis TaxID=369401 RepID=A0A1K2IKB8_9FLAO|nr:pectate lyase [Flaviramulus basaltis]
MNCNSEEGDNIGLQQDNDHIWVHNVDFFYGDAGGDADQAKGDGALDCKRSTYVTFSYNHFWDSGKSNLLGLNEGNDPNLFITYHHNWYDHSDSRHPRIRYYSAHVYNNYYDGNSKYGVGSTSGSSVFVENNYFRNCKYPILTSMQGTDIFYGSPTFSSEDGGTIKAFGNTIIGANRFIPYNFSTPSTIDDFDAVVTSTRNETISNSINSKQGNNTYNNFDTDGSITYTYTPDTPEEAKTKVIQLAGRMNGGDFNWTFNQPNDDTSSSVNVPLKNALIAYTTNLSCIQGISEPPSSQTLTLTTNNSDQTVIEGNAIDPIIFIWGGDATDANVSGLSESGITFIKNTPNKTITISGTPTEDVSYTITTSGTLGTPVMESGIISVGIVASADQIHNFTESGLSSNFYSISGNLSTSKGDAHYNGLTLTQCLKIESSTSITFTTAEESTLTLVFNDAFNGTIKINGVSKNISGGLLTLTIPSGSHEITKDVTTNLYYMSVSSYSLGIKDIEISKISLYPNPVKTILHISSQERIDKVKIYSLHGVLVKSIENNIKDIDISNLSNGNYLIKVYTSQGLTNKIIIKN